jgi:hypothetical protein
LRKQHGGTASPRLSSGRAPLSPTPRPLGPACFARAQILKLLSEEVFDFSRDEMTSAKAKKLKESFNNDFSLIFQLCEFIMGNSTKSTLLVCTFQAPPPLPRPAAPPPRRPAAPPPRRPAAPPPRRPAAP